MNRQFERYLQMTLIVLDLFVLNILYFLCELFLKERIPSTSFYAYLAILDTFKSYVAFALLFLKNVCW